MAAIIPKIEADFNFFVNEMLICYCCYKNRNFGTVSNNLLVIYMLWACAAFWWRDMNIHLTFSAFTSRQISFLASNRAFVFLLI
jgi:hypothetical protein